MDDHQRNSLLPWPSYYSQSKNMEELTQSLLLTTSLELETTRLRAQEELRIRDEQLNHLKILLHKTMAERDEAHNKCQSLLLQKITLQQQQQQHQNQNQNLNLKVPPHSGNSSIEDEQLPNRRSSGCLDSTNNSFSSSDCEESIVSSPVTENTVAIKQPPQQSEQDSLIPVVVKDKALPKNGKFLEAVMKAGPLLQNLLLAGPLPQWRHPPPPLETYHIPPPPVVIHSPPPAHRKRGFCEGSDSSTDTTKYQRVV